MDDEIYSPKELYLVMTTKCQARCDHCSVDANPRGKDLPLDVSQRFIKEAAEKEWNGVRIFGGEPFLHYSGLLGDNVSAVLEKFPLVKILTNGFWGTQKLVARVLNNLQEIAQARQGIVSIFVSVDKYHRKIPIKFQANIFSTYARGDFENVRMGILSFRDEESQETLKELRAQCLRQGVALIPLRKGNKTILYPALKEELFDTHSFSRENLQPQSMNLERCLYDIGEGEREYHFFRDKGKKGCLF